VDDLPVHPDFKRQYYFIGAEYKPTPYACFYTGYRFSNSANSLGLDALNVFTLGIRLDVSRTWERKIF